MKLKKSQLKQIIKEEILELGKVYTDKDKPPFKLNEGNKWSDNWWKATKKLLDSISWVSALTYAPKIPKVVKQDKKMRKLVDELLKQYDRIEKHVDKMNYMSIKEGKMTEAGFGGVQSGPKFSSPEAKKVVDGALKQYATDLRKLQYRVVKDWMSKAKSGVIDFFDLVRGFERGDISRAYPYEVEFLQSVLTKDKIVDRFRKYFGGKKSMNNRTAKKR